MTRPRLDMVLTDDWELRGDGSGNMRAIQFDTLRRITAIYDRHRLRGSFNVEVLQQLAHLEAAERHPELGELAREWEDVVRDVFRRGHDVQLHLHPQWTEATYEDGRWRLGGSWALPDYSREEIASLVRRGREYLEGLLRPLDDGYRCASFRSGGWCIAPSPDVLEVLVDQEIVFDMSVVDGAYFSNGRVHVDYRALQEPFLPYHPDLADARRPSPEPQPIVCVPTHSFADHGLPLPAAAEGGVGGPGRPRAGWDYRVMAHVAPRLPRIGLGTVAERWLERPNDRPIADGGYATDYGTQTWANAGDDEPVPGIRTSDLSMLTYAQMVELLRNARRRARATGWDSVPVIVENHTKDIGNWRPIERFARLLADADDVEVITLRELADRLRAGRYPVRPADGR